MTPRLKSLSLWLAPLAAVLVSPANDAAWLGQRGGYGRWPDSALRALVGL